MEQLVTIELFGQPYTFKAETNVAHAKEVADYLVKEVARIEKKYPNQSSGNKLTTLLLAALNIANEHVELKKSHSDLLSIISKRSANLIQALGVAVTS